MGGSRRERRHANFGRFVVHGGRKRRRTSLIDEGSNDTLLKTVTQLHCSIKTISAVLSKYVIPQVGHSSVSEPVCLRLSTTTTKPT
jgi:hypothetical protein